MTYNFLLYSEDILYSFHALYATNFKFSVLSLRDTKHAMLKIFMGEKEKKDRILFSLIYCI